MALFPIQVQPGIVKNGTEYGSRGRWYDQSLTRWYGEGTLGAIPGWLKYSKSTLTGSARAMQSWRDDSGTRWCAIGTHSKLYVMNAAGTLFDITPSPFTAGRANAVAATGYGYGPYGGYTYGTARPDRGVPLDASVWDLTQWGQYINGCMPEDGHIFQWTLDTATPAQVVSGAPTSCSGVVCTPQRFLFALGAGGNKRKVQWSDQEDNTVWTPSSTNQAGDLDLPVGRIMCGRPVRDEVLVLTDVDAHAFSYIGLPAVYSRRTVGFGCGAISKGAVAIIGQQAVWWSNSGFWLYNGAGQALQCDVWDDLLRNLSQPQRSKITSFHNSTNGEVWWFYPREGASENNAYVFWDYRRNCWGMGSIVRLAACDQGIFKNPFMIGSDGYVYEHENGYAYDGASSAPYGRLGPIELGAGDNVMEVLGIVPDEKTVGDVTVSFRTRFYPNADETTLDENTLTSAGKCDLRFSARQAELVVTGSATTNWRFGTPRLMVQGAGTR